MAEQTEHPQSKVILGDCVQYMHTLADNSFDLAIVDPPYGDAAGQYQRGTRFGGRFCRYFEKNVKAGITTDNANRKDAPTWDMAPTEEYFKKGNERFDRECHGIIKTSEGTIKQESIF